MFRRFRKRQQTAVETLIKFEKEDPASCELRPGLDDDHILKISLATKIAIPEDLRQLLLFTNGAYLFNRGCAIFGCHIGAPPHEVGDISESTHWHRQNSSLTADELVFGQRSGGGVFVMSSGEGTKAQKYRVWFPGEDQFEDEFPSLVGWLLAEISFWREI